MMSQERVPPTMGEQSKVPANVMKQVEQSMQWLRDIRARLDETITTLDERMGCPRRPNFDPPCRLNFDPGLGAGIA